MSLSDEVQHDIEETTKIERTLYVKLKRAAGIVSSIAILFGAFAWAVALAGDTRWAKVEDVKQWDARIVQTVYRTADRMRKQQLEDKVYEITTVPENKRTDTQRAVLDRSIRQLNELAQSDGATSQSQER